MTASVGCSMVGSARCSTRRSPGAYNSAPRMGGSSFRLGDLVSVAAEDLFGDGHSGHRFRPAGVEGQVRDRLDKFLLGGAVLLGEAEVEQELFGVAAGGQRGDRDQAAFLGRELRTCPRLSEQHVVGEVHQRGGEVAFPVMVWSFLMSETSGAGRDPQRRGGRLWADHRVDVGAAEARVLAAVRPVDRGIEVGPVGVGGLVEGDVAFDAAGPDTTRVAVYRPAEPAAAAPSVGAHIQVVGDPYDPDGGVRAWRSVRVQGRDLQFVGGADPVQVVGGPGAHRVAISMMEVVPVAASPLSTAGAGCRPAARWSSRPDIAAADATPDASSRPGRRPAWGPPS